MGAGHGHLLHYHGHSPVHRAPAHLKILTLVAFMLVVVAAPATGFAAHGGFTRLGLGLVAHSRLPFG